jgi:structure-specific recognition protein 1
MFFFSHVQIIASTIATRADVIPATGKGIVTFEELTVLTPRGRYDVELFPTFMKMHGKTYDYKIKYSNIVRLFLLPKPDKYVHILGDAYYVITRVSY